jgi:hypothetical protein
VQGKKHDLRRSVVVGSRPNIQAVKQTKNGRNDSIFDCLWPMISKKAQVLMLCFDEWRIRLENYRDSRPT